MGQIGLGTIFMNAQVANVDTNYTSSSKAIEPSKERSFSKELDKAKTSQSGNQDKNETTKIKDDKGNEVVQKTKDGVTKSEPVNKEKVESKPEDELENSKDKGEIDEKILSLLSQVLNVTTDQLKELLNQMGYAPSDLLKQEMFGKFVSEVYTQIKGENLLMVEDGVKDISQLFDQLQVMCSKTKIEGTPLDLQKQMDVKTNIEKPIEETEQSLLTIQSLNEVEEGNDIEVTQKPQVQSVVQNMNTKTVTQLQTPEEQSNVLNNSVLNETGKVDLGIVVPIQNFSSTVYSQLWQPEGTGTSQQVAQTPQLIETDIIDQIDFKTLGMTKEIHLQLSPKELGELSIKLIEENSNIVAQIKVDNEKAKAFLINEMNSLKTALEERGLTVTDVRVDIKQDTHQSQMEQEKQKSSKRIQEIITKHMEAFEEEEEIRPEKISDSEVDYMV
ncbi:flagellar hook-length control protein FliK [Cellulosilyticum lentocellum]|uniref:Flagellar hook-length control protein-like protein n=1 Tax=Cellulosilyticum lentocellum (strain ATCC 49066 / DSM 5427 / NCIMB 11756 / RHM5) TaxID=642492 RepID=F2JGR8_CELLD|nr:flagellar hook-length control protein FliK [Cellulosilyticum lentocellum]ADZ84160.1 Flagellar hook-length control protein-like protein [Cellulosilyticum lentocellum DSM 5427]